MTSGEAERVGRCITALEPHLMAANCLLHLQEEARVQRHPTLGPGVELHHPALESGGIELLVPGRVETVGKVNPPAVTTELHHLWSAIETLAGLSGMGGAA